MAIYDYSSSRINAPFHTHPPPHNSPYFQILRLYTHRYTFLRDFTRNLNYLFIRSFASRVCAKSHSIYIPGARVHAESRAYRANIIGRTAAARCSSRVQRARNKGARRESAKICITNDRDAFFEPLLQFPTRQVRGTRASLKQIKRLGAAIAAAAARGISGGGGGGGINKKEREREREVGRREEAKKGRGGARKGI